MAQITDTTQRLGIVGAGKIGTSIARAAVAAGYEVTISGSGSIDRSALTIEILAPGAHAATTAQVVESHKLIVLAVPTHKFRELDHDLFNGKVVIDAMNYWEPIDGSDPELAEAEHGSSTIVQAWFDSAKVVKSFNQLGYHQFDEHRQPDPTGVRTAIAAASNHPDALEVVLQLIDDLGFDPVHAGSLEAGKALDPGGPGFGAALPADQLTAALSQLATASGWASIATS
ncbi:hypothetical protein HDC94_000379 [Leifsonia sp. AK011]|uniref:NADPH-dependent F420 reductase n=1 Tax=Leifsonia sp. AK011 TaxID=2723075 RepID=UPI0015CEF22B|nr:NAD(P)-binding domain-containing protein [Leifsonia sp. AK011]NYF09223.1 hypothetical protein [Leifsonia sp. AK011]